MTCHFDKWITRLRQEDLFDDSWINKLQKALNVVYFVTEELINNYQTSNISPTQNELDKLQSVFDELFLVLDKQAAL
jgi:hypothetical protein